MGCHGNHAYSHTQRVFKDGLVSHLGGPNEQFARHEKNVLGVHGKLNLILDY